MFTCSDYFAVKQINFSNHFFLKYLFFNQAQSFCALERAPMSSDCFVNRKNTRRLFSCSLRVSQSVLIVASLNVVIGKSFGFWTGRLAITLKSLSCVAVQTPAANRI